MQLPAIHLNGTDQAQLLDDAGKCYTAIQMAIGTIAQRGPNARDYYIIDDSAYSVARAEHESRLKRLWELAAEYDAICEGINKGGWKRG